MANDNDLIRRGDALTILSNGSQTWGEAVAAIAALPASQPADPVRDEQCPACGTLHPITDKRCPDCKAEYACRPEPLPAIDVLPDPRDAQIAALVDALQNMIEGYEEWDLIGETLILRPIHLQTSWIQRAHAEIAAVKGGDA